MSDEVQRDNALPETLTRRAFLRKATLVVGGGALALGTAGCGGSGGGSSKKRKKKAKKSGKKR